MPKRSLGSVTVYTPKEPGAESPRPTPAKSTLPDLSGLSVEDLFARGTRLIREERLTEALLVFEWAHKLRPSDARSASYYGLALALSGKDPKMAVELCREAIRREFYRVDLYCNLGRVYVVLKDRRKAISTFRKGLSLDGGNEEIHRELEGLGTRQPPVFAFVGRRHTINKFFGKLRARFAPSRAR